MNPRSPTTTSGSGGGGYPNPNKRARHSPPDNGGPGGEKGSPPGMDDAISGVEGGAVGGGPTGGKAGQSSSFRNVSACNRCRLRKNRCDQRLPSCVSCEKANVKCVGYDPITKREIPRR